VAKCLGGRGEKKPNERWINLCYNNYLIQFEFFNNHLCRRSAIAMRVSMGVYLDG
jgi:hypothetical protein